MPKLNIAFDLDGVLIDLSQAFDHAFYRLYGKTLPVKRDEFSFETSMNLTTKQVWRAIDLVYSDFDNITTFPGVYELFTKLFECTGEAPLILTARPFSAATATYQYIKQMLKGTPFMLVLKHPSVTKMAHLKNYKYFVEDRRQTALNLSAQGLTVPLVRKVYNTICNIDDQPNIYYIEGVHELIPDIHLFLKKGF